MKLRMTWMAIACAAGLAACGGGGAKAKPAEPTAPAGASLYDRLGKIDAINAVVKDFVEERVAKDDRIKAFFANTDIPHLEKMLADQICEATGGPCKYTGKDMKTAHTGMKVKDADFTALVEDLVASLDHFKVPEQEKKELLTALGGMHDDIVGH